MLAKTLKPMRIESSMLGNDLSISVPTSCSQPMRVESQMTSVCSTGQANDKIPCQQSRQSSDGSDRDFNLSQERRPREIASSSKDDEELSQRGTISSNTPAKPWSSWSVGSEKHHSGECVPCAWNWKPRGCINGAQCEFCHMCEFRALRLRQKARRTQIALMKKAALSGHDMPDTADFAPRPQRKLRDVSHHSNRVGKKVVNTNSLAPPRYVWFGEPLSMPAKVSLPIPEGLWFKAPEAYEPLSIPSAGLCEDETNCSDAAWRDDPEAVFSF